MNFCQFLVIKSNIQKNVDSVQEDQNPEDYDPQIDFKIVKLKEVEVKTGEESENIVINHRCILFRYDIDLKIWKEKGIGEIKLLQNKVNQNMFRIVMRRDAVHKICANHRISKDLKFEIITDEQILWFVQDFTDKKGKPEILRTKFTVKDDARKFFFEVSKAITCTCESVTHLTKQLPIFWNYSILQEELTTWKIRKNM